MSVPTTNSNAVPCLLGKFFESEGMTARVVDTFRDGSDDIYALVRWSDDSYSTWALPTLMDVQLFDTPEQAIIWSKDGGND